MRAGGRAGVRKRRRSTLALAAAALALAAGLLAAAPTGAAHSWLGTPSLSPAHDAHHAPAAPGAVPWVGIAVALAAVGLTCRGGVLRAGRAAVLALALLVGVFALESAVHSVHHLSDADAVAGCPMLAASQHVMGAGGAPVPAIGAPAPSVAPAVGLEDHCIRPLQSFRPFEGRAPPARPSA